jgi:hypothetical protein
MPSNFLTAVSQFLEILFLRKIPNKISGVLGFISFDSQAILNIETKLKVLFFLKKVVFLYIWPFLTIYHGKKVPY